LADLIELLAPCDVFFVGVHCPLPELERRERHRGDQRPGEAHGDFHTVHRFTEYDLDIHATQPTEDGVARLITAWRARSRPTAFERMARDVEHAQGQPACRVCDVRASVAPGYANEGDQP